MTMRGDWSALGVSHKVIASMVGAGAFCIDATAGNGHDTVFLAELVGERGRVLAMDIQESAVLSTRANIDEHGFSERASVVLKSHEFIDELAKPETADCIVFNFGWLPGGDHSVFTLPETSLAAVEKSLALLKHGGLLSLCLYYGRNNGYGERDALLDWAAGLESSAYNVVCCDFLNRKNDPPFPLFIVKE